MEKKRRFLGETLRYVAVGAVAAGINLSVYFSLNMLGDIHYLVSNIAAWCASTLFSYVADRKFVFKSRASGTKALWREFVMFINGRLFSGVLDQVLMWLLVGVFAFNSSIVKFINSVIVVAVNYLASRFIFTGRKKELEK